MSDMSDRQKRYLSQAIQLEEAVNPRILKATMTMVSLAILVFIVWAGLTNINEVARAPGEVIPEGHPQTVQHLEGGIIKKIFVEEGQKVEAGQVLMALDGAGIRQDLDRALKAEIALSLREEKLRAFLEERQPQWDKFNAVDSGLVSDQKNFFKSMISARQEEKQVVKKQLEEKRQALPGLFTDLKAAEKNADIATEMYERRNKLNAKGYSSDFKLMDARSKMIEKKRDVDIIENSIARTRDQINEIQTRLNSLYANHRDEASQKLAQILVDKSQNKEVIQKLKDRNERLIVRAPVDGMVKGLAVNTISEIVAPGETLLEIIPTGKTLVVEVRISPQDIGHMQAGQPVRIKFSSFDFSRYGSVAGVLQRISAATFNGEKGERFYRGIVGLNKNYVGEDPANSVIPGMTVMADIITGEKTILDYLLKPIQRAAQTAFTER